MTMARLSHGSKSLLAALPLVAAVLLGACGGSSPSTSSAGAPVSPGARSAQSTAGEPGAHTTARAHRDVVSSGVHTRQPMPGTGGGQINDDNPGTADTGGRAASAKSNPCALVSRTEAQAIVGKPIATPVDAPLGPTCIYRLAGTQRVITVTVQRVSFAAIKPHIRNRTQSKIAGHTAYCGTYGQPTTFVPLAAGRVLTVTAPCALGTKFAAKAMPRLKS